MPVRFHRPPPSCRTVLRLAGAAPAAGRPPSSGSQPSTGLANGSDPTSLPRIARLNDRGKCSLLRGGRKGVGLPWPLAVAHSGRLLPAAALTSAAHGLAAYRCFHPPLPGFSSTRPRLHPLAPLAD